jgi:hypothetical protein
MRAQKFRPGRGGGYSPKTGVQMTKRDVVMKGSMY